MKPTPSSHRMVSTTAAHATWTAGLAGLLSALAEAGVGLAVLAVPFAMCSHQGGGSTWIF